MRRNSSLVVLLALGSAAAPGCSSVRLEEASREAYFAGDFDASAELLVELLEEHPRDAHIWNLDLALTELARGRTLAALQHLNAAELDVRSRSAYGEGGLDLERVFSEVSAAVSDDRALPYACRDYERLMLYATLTLVNVLAGGPDAYPNALRAEAERDRLLAEFAAFDDPDGGHPKAAYKLVGLGDYLRAALVEESPVFTSEAREFYRRFLELAPDFPYADDDLARLSGERRRAADEGALYVIGFVGQGPWMESREYVGALDEIRRWVEYIWRVQNDQIPIPDITSILVPELAFARSNPSHVRVRAKPQPGTPSGSSTGPTEFSTGVVTDLEEVADTEFKSMRKSILTRAFLRRLVKVGLGAAAERNVPEEWALLVRIGTWLWTGLERADTRSWDQLPASIQAVRLQLPEGEHSIELSAIAPGGRRGAARTARVSIRRGRHTYLFVIAPTVDRLSVPILGGAVPLADPSQLDDLESGHDDPSRAGASPTPAAPAPKLSEQRFSFPSRSQP